LVVVIDRFPERHLVRPLLGTRMVGAYTTISTFAVEAILLIRDDHVLGALAYVSASILAGLGAWLAGMTGARVVLRRARWRKHGA
jgi:fluoride exporter